MRVIPLALLLGAVVFLADAQAPRTAKEVYDRGTALYREGRFKEAAGFYRMAYEIEPNTSTLLAAATAYNRDRGVVCVKLVDITRLETIATETVRILATLSGGDRAIEGNRSLIPRLNPFDFEE